MKSGIRILQTILMSSMLLASIASFAEGMLYPIVEGKKWGYINASGDVVVEPIYRRAAFFSDGLALVTFDDEERTKAYIDTSGKVVFKVPKGRRYMEDFSEGLAALKESENGNYGFINKQGELVIPFDYLRARRFSEGLAAVEVKEGERYLRGYIDKQGKWAIPPVETNWRWEFSDGMTSDKIETPEGRLYGYMDMKGEIVIPAQYRKAGKFSEGRAFVATKDNQLQLIDKSGDVVATLPFKKNVTSKMPVFSEGYAPASFRWMEKGEPLGFIDRDGNQAFLDINLIRIRSGFTEGLALVNPRGIEETLVIDTDGKEVFRMPSVREVLEPFNHGVVAVNLRGERGVTYYNNKGEMLWKQTP